MTRNHSSSGSMRRISSESSPCRRVLISWKFSQDYPPLLAWSKRSLNSPMTNTSVILPHAQPTWELPWELRFISSSHFLASRTKRCSIRSLTSTSSRSEVFTVNTLRPMTVSTISLIREDSEDPRENSFKTCMMVSKPWLRLKLTFQKRNEL